jgi:Heterokaryon incompatibility protein (HET)
MDRDLEVSQVKSVAIVRKSGSTSQKSPVSNPKSPLVKIRQKPKAPDSSVGPKDYATREQYSYEKLPTSKSIRLVELLPVSHGDMIQINLFTAHLDDNPFYDALSYEWGLPLGTKGSVPVGNLKFTISVEIQVSILCCGHQMSIMRNLHKALQQLRYKDTSRVLWIDGICINQKDQVEQSNQVQLMKQIYQQASEVLCWIGEEKDDTAAAFDVISRLASLCHIECDYERPDVPEPAQIEVDEELVAELEGKVWPAVADVFTRPYFGRIWIVQEVVLATKAIVICGSFEIAWEDFQNVSNVMSLLGSMEKSLQAPDLNHDSVAIFQQWMRLNSIKQLQNIDSIRSRSLTLCLFHLLSQKVTNPLDRVYGMLGMIQPQSASTIKNPLLVDYKKSIQDVYQEACEWCIKDESSLLILDICDTPALNLIKDLPSWVPDLTQGPLKCGRSAEESFQETGVLRSMFEREFSASVVNKTLLVNGLIFDTITLFEMPFTTMDKIALMMYVFRIVVLDPGMYPTGCDKIEALWRCLIQDLVLDFRPGERKTIKPAPASYKAHFMCYMSETFLLNFGLPLKLTGQEPDLKDLNQKSPFSLSKMFPKDVRENISILALMERHPVIKMFYAGVREGDTDIWRRQITSRDWLNHGAVGRQFFFTSQGYMGLGPPCPPPLETEEDIFLPEGTGIMKGDVIAILAGSDKTWILRDDGKDGYTIVGQAYVYGLSEGMCFDTNQLPRMETIRIR